MEPTKTVIERLSKAQRREILLMQEKGEVEATSAPQKRVYNLLERFGVVVRIDSGNVRRFYQLAPAWKDVNLASPKPRKPALYRPRPEPEKIDLKALGLLPDPPKKRQRPPAEYSNRTREQIIDDILNYRV